MTQDRKPARPVPTHPSRSVTSPRRVCLKRQLHGHLLPAHAASIERSSQSDDLVHRCVLLRNALGMDRGNLYRLLRGRIAVSPRTAVALERIGWSNAEFWCRRQALYDLARYRSGMAA